MIIRGLSFVFWCKVLYLKFLFSLICATCISRVMMRGHHCGSTSCHVGDWDGEFPICVQVAWVLGHHHCCEGIWQLGERCVCKPTALLLGSLWLLAPWKALDMYLLLLPGFMAIGEGSQILLCQCCFCPSSAHCDVGATPWLLHC